MIKNTRFTNKTRDFLSNSMQVSCQAKGKLAHNDNSLKVRCNAKDIAQLIVNQRQKKREIASTLVFVCTGR